MKVCIVGAGNIGLALAGSLSLVDGLEVCVYTQSEFHTQDFVFKDVENDVEYTDLPIVVKSNLEESLSSAEYVFCTYPAFLRPDFIQKSASFYQAGSKLGFVPGYGGAEYACDALIENGVTVFGLQRVPFVARQENKKVSMLLSRKTDLYVAALPKDQTETVCEEIEKMLQIKTHPLNTYLAVTLAPSNPLLHLTGLYNVFKDYKPGDYYTKQLMFYAEWNDDASEMLLEYDQELQDICSDIPLDLSEVVPLKTYYEAPTPSAMTRKLKSIKAFEVVTVPLTEKDGKYYPDFNSRMFTEDFPYGIAIIKYFGILVNAKTKVIDTILNFYKDKTGICYYESDNTFGKDFSKTGAPYNFGLKSLEDILQFYTR